MRHQDKAAGRRPQLGPGLPQVRVPSAAPAVVAFIWTLAAIYLFWILQP
jgi:hypothetical protein